LSAADSARTRPIYPSFIFVRCRPYNINIHSTRLFLGARG
jgi:hypothetical protein